MLAQVAALDCHDVSTESGTSFASCRPRHISRDEQAASTFIVGHTECATSSRISHRARTSPRTNTSGRKQCLQLWRWILHQFKTTPERTVPIMFSDMNLRFGIHGSQSCADASIGPCQAGPEDDLAQRLQTDMLAHELCAVNNYWNLGPSYYGAKGSNSRIDYFVAPTSLKHTTNRM
eukprot:5560220-Pyramimonas_sp.AAC.1